MMQNQIKHCFKRYEKKYFLTPEQYKLFKEKMSSFVKADYYPKYTLCNIYYDTDDYRLIRASIEKPVYKEKLRVRSYGVAKDNSKVFVELKKKYDGVVYKRRITASPLYANALLNGINPSGQSTQITKEIEYFRQFYLVKPKVFIAYDREAYQGIENSQLRITFDTNMRYRLDDLDLRAGDCGDMIIDTDNILMEIKIPGACPLWLSQILNELKIYPVSFSKYGHCYKEHILKSNKTIFTKEARLSA